MQVHLLWPEALLAGLAVPAFVWFYVRIQRLGDISARAHPHFYAQPTHSSRCESFTRHLPITCFAAALSLVVLALARPSATVDFMAKQGKVVLAIDVSASMRASDVTPSRLDAAKKLAKQFVAVNSDALRIAVVSFAGTAVAETDFSFGREELFSAIDRLGDRAGTSVGHGIIEALRLILPGIDPQAVTRALAEGRSEDHENPDPGPRNPASKPTPPAYSPAAIILLSDGQSSAGPPLAAAARLAADHGVRIHTIGMGTPEGSVLREGGRSMRVQLDDATLRQIAASTAGRYAHATMADWPTLVASIRPGASDDDTYTEVTAVVAGLAALFALLGATIALHSTHRIL